MYQKVLEEFCRRTPLRKDETIQDVTGILKSLTWNPNATEKSASF